MTTQITWDNFKIYNPDALGIQHKFEELCRQIFTNEYIADNQKHKYLHSNPNNPGLETDPIYDEKNKRWIGFQSKFFESRIDYEQIQKSAKKIVTHYAGKVEHVFLFSNKPIDSNSKSLKKILDILSEFKITLELITDTTILDIVRKHPDLALYYFGNHTINQEWLEKNNRLMFSYLGVRYNQEFNVNTTISQKLSLFIIDKDAINYINNKKLMLIEKIQNLRNQHYNQKYQTYLHALKNSVQSISDITNENIFEAIDWKETIESAVKEYIKQMNAERHALQLLLEQQRKNALDMPNGTSKEFLAREKYYNLLDKIKNLTALLELSNIVAISTEEQRLLKAKVLLIDGEAGIGKSQLLADETHKLLNLHMKALLLLANQYISNAPIQKQIMQNLSLDYDFEELIDVLDVSGKSEGNIVPIFIDALNETWILKTWEIGLPVIINKIQESSMVKLVLTYRSEFAKVLGLKSDNISQCIETGKIVKLHHIGFRDNSISAITQFLNYFNIPFTLLNFLNDRMTNPLFLTIYCKTYNGEEVDLPKLYERLIENANNNIHKMLESDPNHRGYIYDDNILEPLIAELSNIFIEQNAHYISKNDICNLNYWQYYGFKPAKFLNLLAQEQILYTTISSTDKEQYFYLAYDQMNDYYCANVIFIKCNTKDEVRECLCEEILGIHAGTLKKYINIDLFINACALYADRYQEECIDLIDSLTNEDKTLIFSKYVSSFQWRKRESISAETFLDLIQKYPCELDTIWETLIGNSLKGSHPLNANFLHNLLLKLQLNTRDYLWTSYINNLTYEDSNRIVQLINMYNRGDKLKITDERQIELLLTLFAWLLTSSNRRLRDCTSKAMIEILKEHFSLCKRLLQKFEHVNDPYVIQRLYGIVFGACCKLKQTANDTFQDLALYVYDIIFNKEKVYPDILLRDYARLIIERYLSEFPKFKENKHFDYKKIIPPYKSDPIADIEPIDYSNIKYSTGLFKIIKSMTFEGNNIGIGLYGDFGRYVFQSALRYFKKIDYKKIFDYAIHYILNELRYLEDYFGNIDRNLVSYDRHQTLKIERIGKKYQWIAMYNILARVSDHYKLSGIYSSQDNEDDFLYEGAWEPYVRDFDPTLNINSMYCAIAPRFKYLDDFIRESHSKDILTNVFNVEQQNSWLKSKGVYFHKLKDILRLTDDDGTMWISLTKYCDTRSNLETDRLSIWSWLYAYFLTQEQEDIFKEYFEKGTSIINDDISTHHEAYTIYNREYPWATSCKTFENYAWVKARINTEKEIGHILHTTTNLIWEEIYDASKESTISYEVPCAKLINDLNLSQKEEDSFYYDEEGNLAAFDTNITQHMNGVVIRKDLLEQFLKENNLKLVWFVQIEKEIYTQNGNILNNSNWEAFFSYTPEEIKGEIRECL